MEREELIQELKNLVDQQREKMIQDIVEYENLSLLIFHSLDKKKEEECNHKFRYRHGQCDGYIETCVQCLKDFVHEREGTEFKVREAEPQTKHPQAISVDFWRCPSCDAVNSMLAKNCYNCKKEREVQAGVFLPVVYSCPYCGWILKKVPYIENRALQLGIDLHHVIYHPEEWDETDCPFCGTHFWYLKRFDKKKM